jgi:hypothetical protein
MVRNARSAFPSSSYLKRDVQVLAAFAKRLDAVVPVAEVPGPEEITPELRARQPVLAERLSPRQLVLALAVSEASLTLRSLMTPGSSAALTDDGGAKTGVHHIDRSLFSMHIARHASLPMQQGEKVWDAICAIVRDGDAVLPGMALSGAGLKPARGFPKPR